MTAIQPPRPRPDDDRDHVAEPHPATEPGAALAPDPEGRAERHEPLPERHDLDDREFRRLFGIGALFGIPILYVIAVVLGWLAYPDRLGLVMVAMIWPALLAGWYFGGMIALTLVELRHARRPRPDRQPVEPSG